MEPFSFDAGPLAAISQETEDFVIGMDTAGTIVYADPEVLAALGRRAADLGKFTVGDVLGSAEVARAARAVGRLFADEPMAGPLELHFAHAVLGEVAMIAFAWCVKTADGATLVAVRMHWKGAPAA